MDIRGWNFEVLPSFALWMKTTCQDMKRIDDYRLGEEQRFTGPYPSDFKNFMHDVI